MPAGDACCDGCRTGHGEQRCATVGRVMVQVALLAALGAVVAWVLARALDLAGAVMAGVRATVPLLLLVAVALLVARPLVLAHRRRVGAREHGSAVQVADTTVRTLAPGVTWQRELPAPTVVVDPLAHLRWGREAERQ